MRDNNLPMSISGTQLTDRQSLGNVGSDGCSDDETMMQEKCYIQRNYYNTGKT